MFHFFYANLLWVRILAHKQGAALTPPGQSLARHVHIPRTCLSVSPLSQKQNRTSFKDFQQVSLAFQRMSSPGQGGGAWPDVTC